MQNVLQRFDMDNAKTLSVPLDQYFKLSTVMSPTIDGDVVKY